MRRSNRGFTLVELMVVIGILALLVGILAVAVIPRLMGAKAELEKKTVKDLYDGLNTAATGKKGKRALNKAKDKAGYQLYGLLFKKKLLEAELLDKVVSGGGPDVAADQTVIDNDDVEFTENNCSYTAPKASKLSTVISKSGSKQTVVITFNARNWNNYDDKGVIMMLSSSSTPEYRMAEDLDEDEIAEKGWEIDKDSFKNPDEVIGQKKPFDNTFN